jgi:hypothetical protein
MTWINLDYVMGYTEDLEFSDYDFDDIERELDDFDDLDDLKRAFKNALRRQRRRDEAAARRMEYLEGRASRYVRNWVIAVGVILILSFFSMRTYMVDREPSALAAARTQRVWSDLCARFLQRFFEVRRVQSPLDLCFIGL